LVAYVRTVKTSSGATAVQIVWSSRRGSRRIEHLGSAHDESGMALLKAAAAQRLAAGQARFDPGLVERSESEPLPITCSKSAHLWDALCTAYDALGLDKAADGDEAFRQLVLARITEPTSKADSLRVIEEDRSGAGVVPDGESPLAGVCQTRFPAGTFDCMRDSCPVGVGQSGALSRDHLALRDRCR